MIVHDLDRVGTIGRPDETDPILIVDPDAMLTGTVARQRLETIPRRDTKVLQSRSRVQLLQLPPGNPPEFLRTSPPGSLRVPPVEDVLRPRAPKGSDHVDTIARSSCYIKLIWPNMSELLEGPTNIAHFGEPICRIGGPSRPSSSRIEGGTGGVGSVDFNHQSAQVSESRIIGLG